MTLGDSGYTKQVSRKGGIEAALHLDRGSCNRPAFATTYHSMTDPAQVSPPPKTIIST